MQDEVHLIYSPLQQHYSVDGYTVEICIYRLPDTPWTLEVVDEHGNSSVWDDEFETDQAAFDEFLRTLREDGIASLIGAPSQAHEAAARATGPFRLAVPLLEGEMGDLDAFLMSDATSDETMWLDQLDGYLTAIVIGPTTLNMSQWYSGIWGTHEDDAPHFETLDEAQHIMELIMRHYNGIIGSLQQDADAHQPLFDVLLLEDEAKEFLNGEMWAAGFLEGLALCRPDWQALFDDPRGQEWLEPIRLLGAAELGAEEEERVPTPEQCEEWTRRIPASVAAIYRYWLPYREALHELQLAKTFKRAHPKIGRNDPCPCGSGKKFKKCCGVAAILH